MVDPETLPQGIRYRVVTGILRDQEERVRNYLVRVKKALSGIVEILLEQEKISGDRLREILRCEAA